MRSFERVLVLAVATVLAANDPSPPRFPYPFGGAFGALGREPLGSAQSHSATMSDPPNHAVTVSVVDELDLREATGVIVPTKVPDRHGADDAALVGSTDHWRKLLNVTDNEDPRGVIELQGASRRAPKEVQGPSRARASLPYPRHFAFPRPRLQADGECPSSACLLMPRDSS